MSGDARSYLRPSPIGQIFGRALVVLIRIGLFPVPTGSAVEAFNDLAPRYPVFELQPLEETADRAGATSR